MQVGLLLGTKVRNYSSTVLMVRSEIEIATAMTIFPLEDNGALMFDIKFQIGGRTVNPKRMKDALEGAILESVQGSIKKSVGSVRCSEHGASPKVLVKGRNLDSLQFEVSGCCDTLIEQVKRKLK